MPQSTRFIRAPAYRLRSEECARAVTGHAAVVLPRPCQSHIGKHRGPDGRKRALAHRTRGLSSRYFASGPHRPAPDFTSQEDQERRMVLAARHAIPDSSNREGRNLRGVRFAYFTTFAGCQRSSCAYAGVTGCFGKNAFQMATESSCFGGGANTKSCFDTSVWQAMQAGTLP